MILDGETIDATVAKVGSIVRAPVAHEKFR